MDLQTLISLFFFCGFLAPNKRCYLLERKEIQILNFRSSFPFTENKYSNYTESIIKMRQIYDPNYFFSSSSVPKGNFFEFLSKLVFKFFVVKFWSAVLFRKFAAQIANTQPPCPQVSLLSLWKKTWIQTVYVLLFVFGGAGINFLVLTMNRKLRRQTHQRQPQMDLEISSL